MDLCSGAVPRSVLILPMRLDSQELGTSDCGSAKRLSWSEAGAPRWCANIGTCEFPLGAVRTSSYVGEPHLTETPRTLRSQSANTPAGPGEGRLWGQLVTKTDVREWRIADAPWQGAECPPWVESGHWRSNGAMSPFMANGGWYGTPEEWQRLEVPLESFETVKAWGNDPDQLQFATKLTPIPRS